MAPSPLIGRAAALHDLVQAGSSNAAAARRLSISERTVEFHLSRVYRKLAVDGREQLHELVG